MNANGKPDRQGGPESADLRSALRAWTVAGAPPGVEERLRSTFRRRRAGRRRSFWLAAAAVLAVVAIPLWHASRPVPPSASRSPVPTRPVERAVGNPSTEPTRAEAGQTNASGAKSTHSRLARRRVTSTAGRTEAVIVEPGQAELVRQLGQQLSRVRQAPPGISVPRVEVAAAYAAPPSIPEVSAVEVSRYEASWEPVTGEWPATQRSVPTSWR